METNRPTSTNASDLCEVCHENPAEPGQSHCDNARCTAEANRD